MKVAVVGAGWAGVAAAVEAVGLGHEVTVFEATRSVGGRARGLVAEMSDGKPVTLDNGQHILIGAYTETLRLMRLVGANPDETLQRLPLTLLFPSGEGLALPGLPAPLDALLGILRARGWSWRDKASLLQTAARWQRQGFVCAPQTSVTQLCEELSATVMHALIEPLCVSALNTPADQASAQVFLRVLQDSLMGAAGASNMLLPIVDLTTLFPQAAIAWLRARHAQVQLGTRVSGLQEASTGWCIDGRRFDAVVLATSASSAALALAEHAPPTAGAVVHEVQAWINTTLALRFEAITTVYAYGSGARLAHPMLALRSQEFHAPAQFAFDRGQLGGPSGLLAFVVSASQGDRAELQAQVLAQAQVQLGLSLMPVLTVVEKRATFACTPSLVRPKMRIAAGLFAAGDYVAGPYPATLEGAVRSGVAAARAL